MTDIYHEYILDLYKNPLHQGEIKNSDQIIDQTNSSCGDSIKIYIKLDGEFITDLKWQGAGCVISQTAMSILADYILENKLSIKQVQQINQEKLLNLLGLENINPGREKCLMLGLSALKKNK